MKTKFYRCPVCGNVMLVCVDSQVVPNCCNRPMELLEPHTQDEKQESHLPVADIVTEDTVRPHCDPFYLSHYNRRYHTHICIGEQPHPMHASHHICFIYYETQQGGQMRYLALDHPVDECFYSSQPPTAIYAYCNIHGLWKLNLNKD